MGLFTFVSAIVFLSFGVTILVYLLKTILSAIPMQNPFHKVRQLRLTSALDQNKTLIAQLQEAQRLGQIDHLRSILTKVSVLKSNPPLYTEEIPVVCELYLTVLDCGVFLLEETGARFSELPKFEELLQSRNDLMTRLHEVINIKNKLTKRRNDGEKPKEWAVKEINSQEQSLREQITANYKEVRLTLIKLIEVSKQPVSNTNHKYH